MISGAKVMKHDVLAREWFYDLLTRPNMRIKVGRMPRDIRIWGRIVGVRSTKQFVGIKGGDFCPRHHINVNIGKAGRGYEGL